MSYDFEDVADHPILQTGEYPQSCESGWYPRPCVQSMRIPTSRGFYRHFQPFPLSVCGSLMLPVPKNSKPSCLNDYRPVALTSIVMKVFERLLKNHICSSIPATLDPLQFAYRPNRSTDDAISQVLHSSLTHIYNKYGSYVRLRFIDYSSAFNTIVPIKTAFKLTDLGLNSSLCDWI